MSKLFTGIELSPIAYKWLSTTKQASILHIFERTCNLINASGDVLSIVDTQIGNGPFSITVENLKFSNLIIKETITKVSDGQIQFPEHVIITSNAKLWKPKPDWEIPPKENLSLLANIIQQQLINHAPTDSFSYLCLGLDSKSTLPNAIKNQAIAQIKLIMDYFENGQLSSILQAARNLAGLGPGLTPAGDDLLVGVMHGIWLCASDAVDITSQMLSSANERTNKLSMAWLLAASQGMAGEPWHHLLIAVHEGNDVKIRNAIHRILPTGHTSGADALAGFLIALEQHL